MLFMCLLVWLCWFSVNLCLVWYFCWGFYIRRVVVVVKFVEIVDWFGVLCDVYVDLCGILMVCYLCYMDLMVFVCWFGVDM